MTLFCWVLIPQAFNFDIVKLNTVAFRQLIFFRVIFFSCFLLTLGCKEKHGDNQANAPSDGEKLPARNPGYFYLTGQLGQSLASLHLIAEGDKEGKMLYNGTLLLPDHPEPIDLYTQGEVNDSVLMLNFEENGNECRMSAAIKADGSLEGICTGFRGSSLVFRFQPAKPSGGLTFTSIFHDTTFRARANRKRPLAFFGYHFLVPQNENWLCDSLLNLIHGDSLCRAGGGNPGKIFDHAGAEFFKLYQTETEKLGIPDTSDESFDSFNQEILHGVQVFYNENKLLSIGLTEYDYFGGAHGLFFTRVASFDANSRKRIRLKDLFRPGFEPLLKEAINEAARVKYGVRNLSEVLLVDEIELTDNFFTTPAGICFSYEPYQIAPFVMGEPRFFIPFSQLKEITR